MSPDAELPLPPARGPKARLVSLDCRVFTAVAERHWPGADQALPRLSRAANHGVLWFATGAALAATRHPRARRAAVRGVASLALASATINTLGKRSVRRARPLLDGVPLMRRLKRQPLTTSFPSGHAASAAAFATGVALESRGLGAAVAPLAGAVALSRVYTGVHFPSDVLAGAALGAGAAFAVRGLVPTRSQLPPPGRPRVDAPALPGGRGLVVVVNEGARTPERVRPLLDALPHAEVVRCAPGEVAAELDKAAERARVLGVCGGDGTVNAAAAAALRHDVPLVVVPGGTLNHFAQDLGADDPREVAAAIEAGDAVAVDVGRFSAGRGDGYFLNTFSLGVYPELVRERERWSPRIGGWPAGVLAAARVLRSDRQPLRAEFQGTERALWLLFAGNCVYNRLGLAPSRRFDLADGLLDVRVVHGGRRPGTRLLAAALTSPVERSPVQTSIRRRRLRVEGLAPGTVVAYDGEITPVEGELLIEKLPEALTVYRPSQLLSAS
ncbi:bifunctional phosphatase PAP2/diacylglycerol kinase family protein [Streptomyces spectabilis]|uniref:Phosphatase PAP2 family protein n=1 Tax=Streptomyces spectabilis TaxID=68270 RepID=A0A5P2XEQ9_STRST|nr:bifunctional phosphatase PAP2/diacylglycerol kinase family protein [Streptomyces spectabilis]MBB5107030.1 undecaprenyl-diphosphatase [Streptomyces spectabilis]MCI3906079.1 phosphatase PAP2 family protein [Streptomyces spectabilis]QEV62971.1 phosphatase PAP2 family protein [Streptomyces spectabilis]GGV05001.1 phosphoesterase [Streptomyces spectabilis]